MKNLQILTTIAKLIGNYKFLSTENYLRKTYIEEGLIEGIVEFPNMLIKYFISAILTEQEKIKLKSYNILKPKIANNRTSNNNNNNTNTNSRTMIPTKVYHNHSHSSNYNYNYNKMKYSASNEIQIQYISHSQKFNYNKYTQHNIPLAPRYNNSMQIKYKKIVGK
jgi:hypothetical protein